MRNIILMKDFYYENLFEQLNIVIPKNRLVAISGHNNCGKTTLMRILNREIITDNIVLINETDINDYLIEDYTKLVQCVIPLEVIWELDTLKEELDFLTTNSERIDDIVTNLKIKKIINKHNKEYTNKEIVLSQLAIALIRDPKILLLDSIGNYFTKKEMNEIIQFLKEYQKQNDCTIIMTTIHLEETIHADYLYIIDDKKIVLEGTPLEVLEKDNFINKIGLSLPFMIDLSVKLRDYDLIKHIELDKNRMVEELWK